MFNEATLEMLEDMERTLKGDVPILVGSWTGMIPINDDGQTHDCGCLMMDGHVQQFRNDFDTTQPARFLARLYFPYRQAEGWKHINVCADEFDKWAKSRDAHGYLRYRTIGFSGITRKLLKDDARAELLDIVQDQMKSKAPA